MAQLNIPSISTDLSLLAESFPHPSLDHRSIYIPLPIRPLLS